MQDTTRTPARAIKCKESEQLTANLCRACGVTTPKRIAEVKVKVAKVCAYYGAVPLVELQMAMEARHTNKPLKLLHAELNRILQSIPQGG